MIGPLLALAAGYGLFSVLLLVLEKDRDLRRFWQSRVTTALITALVFWKIAPLLTKSDLILDDPILLLSLGGGLAGAVGGAFAFAGVVLMSLAQVKYVHPEARRWPLAVPALAGALVVGAWFAAEPVLFPPASASPGAAGALTQAVPDLGGMPHTLADLKGQVVVVNFWATWCPPCRAELPEFQKYQAPEGLKVVGIDLLASETGGLEAVKTFVEDKQMAWTQWVDDRGRLAEAFGVTSIPTTVVLDPQGRVVDRRVGAVDLLWLKGLEGRFLGR